MTTPTYTPQSWVNGSGGNTPLSAARLLHMEAGIAAAEETLIATAVKTSAYTAVPQDLVRCDTTGGAFAVQLPTAPPDGTTIAVKLIAQTGTNAVTINRGGTDVFNKTGGSTSLSVGLLNQLVQVEYFGGIWTVLDSLALASLDDRFLVGQRLVTTSLSAGNLTTVATAAGDAAGLTVTFTAVAGKTYEVKAKLAVTNTLAATVTTVQLCDSANAVLDSIPITPRTANDQFQVVLQKDVSPSAGSVTYKVRFLTSSASGTATIIASAATPALLTATRVA